MASQTDEGFVTLTAAGAISRFARVKDNGSGKLVVAVAADGGGVEIGQAEREAFAADEVISVRLTNQPGTCKMIAKAAITAFAKVYTDIEGKIGVTGTNKLVGIAFEAAAADGDIIEVARANGEE